MARSFPILTGPLARLFLARSRYWGGWVAVAIVVLSSGCGRNESVRHYSVPKREILFAMNHVERSGSESQPDAASSAPTDRMLAAIVPHGTQTWYFKMTGPLDAVAKQEAAFRGLIESLHFDSEQSRPQWTLPPSWQQNPASGQRTATLSVESDGQPLEISVTQLASAPSDEAILDNVNRWRRQMGLADIPLDQLPRETTSVDYADGTAILVNLVGRFASAPMGGGQMAGGSFGMGAPAMRNSAAKSTLEYEQPDGWTSEPPPQFCDLAFGIRDGGASATVTISQLPGDAGGMVANIDRWRRQIGLPPMADGALDQSSEDWEIQGIKGKYVELAGSGSGEGSEAIYGWIGLLPQKAVFIKIKGNAQLVRNQRDRFRAFLNSVKFTASSGVANGN